ncbi:MAG: tetratricopeptide repeat protein [Desulfobacteraceae bacterium]|nr:MAG: tetratricopeptide repeat protein [Desulfobacteraceae bacterium]
MTDQPKFTAKEIHFLKSDPQSDTEHLSEPDTYLSDLLFMNESVLAAFEGRLKDIDIGDHPCVCAVFRIDPAACKESAPPHDNAPEDQCIESDDDRIDDIRSVFETLFNSLLDHERGIWEHIRDDLFAFAFFDFKAKKQAIEWITLLKEKIEIRLNTRITGGLCFHPFQEYSLADTFHNAVKALDHAAFYEPGRVMLFDAVSLNICGDRCYQCGRNQDAISEYQAGIRLDQTDINLLNSLGVCYGIENDLEQAKKQFKKALTVNPKDPMVLYNMGLIYSTAQSDKRAAAYLRKAHAIDPQVFEVEFLLGQILQKDEKPDLALPHLENACRLNPEASIPFKLCGDIYLEKEQLEKAYQFYTKAIKLNPEDADSLSGAAHILERQNKNISIALTFARKSVDLCPDSELYRERLSLIQSRQASKDDRKRLKAS